MAFCLETIAATHGIHCDDALREKFIQWAEEKYAQTFIDSLMERAKVIEGMVNDLANPFKNGRKGTAYSVRCTLPDPVKNARFCGLNELGLSVHCSETSPLEYHIFGVPLVAGEQEVTLEYEYDGWVPNLPSLKRIFRFAINPDPRDLWKEIPVSDDIEYPKPDLDAASLRFPVHPNGVSGKTMLAASRRGRSHAHEGKPRDDHFLIDHTLDTNWYILAVADGAGSAEFSRAGSKIACSVAVEYCAKKLASLDNELDSAINTFWLKCQEKNMDGKKLSTDALIKQLDSYCTHASYHILAQAAFAAKKAIVAEAESHKRNPKLYATTLLLTICKKIRTFWYIISFNIGDGAIGILYGTEDTPRLKLLCTPDEGAYSGQTRFLTMNEVFSDSHALFRRLHTAILRDFRALLLMTDGISDAKFETNANLNNPKMWQELWNDLSSSVPFTENEQECQKSLLEWLNFWVPGNHDDRTIAILY